MTLNERKEILKEIALNNYSNGGQIYRLINQGYLDHIINKISDENTITNSTAIVKKGYLTGNEQFIDILAELLHWFESDFITLEHKEWQFHNILEKKIPKFLLCKKYWGNNKYIPYYKKNINKLFVENLYINIKYIYEEFEDFFKSVNINKNMSLNNTNDIDTLLKLMKELIWCNYKQSQYSFDYLFSNYKYRIKDFKIKYKKSNLFAENKIYEIYTMHWNILINGYKKNIEIIKKVI